MHWFSRAKTRPVLAPTTATNEAEAPSATNATSETDITTPPRSRRRLFRLLKFTGLGIAAVGGASVLQQQNAGTAYASAGVFSSNVSTTPAVLATGTNGARGVTGSSDTGYGVTGVSTSSVGLRGSSTSGSGVYGTSVSTTGAQAGVYGQDSSGSVNGMGTYGTSVNGSGVHGNSTNGIGVYGTSSGDHGVYGDTTGNGAAGVFGQDDSSTSNSFGVYASSTNGTGLYGTGSTGIYAYTPNGGTGLYASGGNSGTGTAALLYGNVNVTGSLSKGGGSFLIDHPLDPANRSLYHSFVESPDMKNIYDGVAILDAKGEAIVTLPDWFETLNSEFRYQLTCLGGYAPVYIASEIAHNQFTIAGGQTNMKVSWQVTGIRQDAWANKHRIPVEEIKTGADKGKYHHPELFGVPKERGISYRPVPAPAHTPGK